MQSILSITNSNYAICELTAVTSPNAKWSGEEVRDGRRTVSNERRNRVYDLGRARSNLEKGQMNARNEMVG
jgi:hypothetical protein